MRFIWSTFIVFFLISWPFRGYGQDPSSLLKRLPFEVRTWVERSCPRSLGPSLWSACVRREVAALSRGVHDLSQLPEDQRSWVSRSCPTSLGPSLYISCVNREVAALSAGMPDTSALSAQQRQWVDQSCPASLGPSLYGSCVARELQALRSISPSSRPRRSTAPSVNARSTSSTPQTQTRRPTVRYDATVLQAQVILKSFGFYRGSLDGISGPQTLAAVKSFQSRIGLNPTGELDTPTFGVLLSLVRKRPGGRASSHSADCEGYNSETGAYVYGECDDSDFEGYDTETGNYVYGDCEPDGDLEAYDSETGVYVYGECD